MEAKIQDSEPPTPGSTLRVGLRDRSSMEDADGTLSSVAQCIELLRRSSSTNQDKEHSLKQLLELIETRDKAFGAVGSHSQAVPTLVSLLRTGPLNIKILSSTVLTCLCKEDELRVKVLLGGSIPALLALLKSSSKEGQMAAAETIHAVSQGGAKDHVGSKIFSTEGVVPVLWEKLKNGLQEAGLVDTLLTGTLRNLCNTAEGFWVSTEESDGTETLLKLLAAAQPGTLANVCCLLGCLVLEKPSACSTVASSGGIKLLLKLLSPGNEASVRAEAAGALKSLSAKSKEARKEIAGCNGIPALINATIAPSKEFMQGEHAKSLQESAMSALANISGGLSFVIASLAESLACCGSAAQTADTLGALASALMIYDEEADSVRASDPVSVERVLVGLLRKKKEFLVEERAVEAMASLYGNRVLAAPLEHAAAKHLLVGLATMADPEAREYLTRALLRLCGGSVGGGLWGAFGGREGVQLLISLLGLASEQQQECAVALLSLLSSENDDCKWAITAAGGIPPLVQILETGSVKAKEDSAAILGNLCNHSEDIRACVQSADAVPALLWLLKNGSEEGKEMAARTLNHLIQNSDSGTVSQLSALLTSDQPESKLYVLEALRRVLAAAPLSDVLTEGGAANDALETMVKVLGSAKEETQVKAAAALAALFRCRRDLRESPMAARTLWAAVKLLGSDSPKVLAEAAGCLASIFLSVNQNADVAAAGRLTLAPLVSLASSAAPEVAERATSALANLLLDKDVSLQASPPEIISPAAGVLADAAASADGKAHAAAAIARLLQPRPLTSAVADHVNRSGAVLSLAALLDSAAAAEALAALSILSRADGAALGGVRPPWAVLAEHPEAAVPPLASCIPRLAAAQQDQAVEVLSRLCYDQAAAVGDAAAGAAGCAAAIARRVIASTERRTMVGGGAVLVCAAREHPSETLAALNDAGLSADLVRSLVAMIPADGADDIRVRRRPPGSRHVDGTEVISGDAVAAWLLSVLARYDGGCAAAAVSAAAVDVLTDALSRHLLLAAQSEAKQENGAWGTALALAVLFRGREEMIGEEAVGKAIAALASLLRSEEAAGRYFAAQAVGSLVAGGRRGTLLGLAQAGAVVGLVPLLGCAESDVGHLADLGLEFGLEPGPEMGALEGLFAAEEIRGGAAARKAIPALVDLLKPIPDRPGAPFLALRLLTRLAAGSPANAALMAEAGAVEGLARYLSLGPGDETEEASAGLLGLLFRSPEIRRHESAGAAVGQLVAVLRLGGRTSRLAAARALESLFSSDHIRAGEPARQAVQPLLEILGGGSEREQHAAVAALVALLSGGDLPRAAETELAGAADVLCRILAGASSPELKAGAAELCHALFAGCSRARSSPAAARCVDPLAALLAAGPGPARLPAVQALDRLLEEDHLADLVAQQTSTLASLVALLSAPDPAPDLPESAARALAKLARDRPASKVEMVRAGALDGARRLLPAAAAAELLRILTNNASVAKSPAAGVLVRPLLAALSRPDQTPDGLRSSLQALANLLEHPPARADRAALEPVIALLDSPAPAVQQLAAQLVAHLAADDALQRDPAIAHAIPPLVQALGSGPPSTQHRAIRALAGLAPAWPSAIAKQGGVHELCKLILQADPPLPQSLWEAASAVLSAVLQFSSEFFLEVPVAALVRLLRSGNEGTVVGALNALLVLDSDDSTSAEAMAESGAVEALLELLRGHICEEAAARLLEALLNNTRIRDGRAARGAVAPLALYLLDPQTQSAQGRLLAALALGDLVQNEGLARGTDAVAACRALVNLLEEGASEEMKVVAICALQNLVMASRGNKRAVAEAGGVQVVLDLIAASEPETSVQAAMFIKLLFSGLSIQEYASSETVRAITAAVEKDLWASGSANEEYLRALNALLGNFPRLRATEPATLSIPHLVTALKTGSEATQEAALEALNLLRQAWSACPAEVSKTQAVAASEAIPLLQYLIQSGPPRFQEKAELLLQCLPGVLTVIIKRASNLKQSVGVPSVFCKLTLGSNPPRQTQIVSTGPTPEWNEPFAWAFDSPPKGQKLHISCKNKSKLGKSSFGKVTIQIDRVVMLGSVAGEYALLPASKSGPRNLEIEFVWSNK
ncbi:binding protein [Wolffia australiana]